MQSSDVFGEIEDAELLGFFQISKIFFATIVLYILLTINSIYKASY